MSTIASEYLTSQCNEEPHAPNFKRPRHVHELTCHVCFAFNLKCMPTGAGTLYNVTTAAVAAASASINSVTLAEDVARYGDLTSAAVAIYVAQETAAAAAAALQKDYSSSVNHANTVSTLGHDQADQL